MRVGGRWKYLFPAVDKHGQLIDFMLFDRRNSRAAYRFLRKALKTVSDRPPSSVTTNKLASYPKAIRRLQEEDLLSKDVEHRTSKYLNNIIRGRPRRAQALDPADPRFPKDENSLRDDRRL